MKIKHEIIDIKIRSRVVIFYPKDVSHSECCDVTDIDTKFVSYDRTPVAANNGKKKK